MSIIDVQIRTVTCNTCGATATYENSGRGVPPEILAEYPWLTTNRVVVNGEGKNFDYCSDLCEIAGIETKQHNTPEKPKVEVPQGSVQAQIQAAALAAKQREDATKALKEGSQAKVHL